jgi:hypothetical protein
MRQVLEVAGKQPRARAARQYRPARPRFRNGVHSGRSSAEIDARRDW